MAEATGNEFNAPGNGGVMGGQSVPCPSMACCAMLCCAALGNTQLAHSQRCHSTQMPVL